VAKQKGTPDRPYWSALVVDGDVVKLRLLAERQASKTPVHIDWVRFSVIRRNVAALSIDTLFPLPKNLAMDIRNPRYRDHDASIFDPSYLLQDAARRMPIYDQTDEEFIVGNEAFELAERVATALGKGFTVFSEPKKGIDFYRFRWSIELNGQEVGWVGYLSSSNSPHQDGQANSIHVNLFGMACTFADIGWRIRIADICDDLDGTLTRCDLALDFFDGVVGGVEQMKQDYIDGLCNVGGRKLKFNQVGDWANGHDRSIYIGSRESGKITNAYEKGDQLFGAAFNSEWLRIELRYGNKHRVLSSEMLRRPSDFFAGASDWHASMLLKADAIVMPELVKCIPRLQIETVEAECSRNVRWFGQTAGATMALAIQSLGFDELWSILEHQKLPGRLRKFSTAEIKRSMSAAFTRFENSFNLKKIIGTDATYSVDSCPAVA